MSSTVTSGSLIQLALRRSTWKCSNSWDVESFFSYFFSLSLVSTADQSPTHVVLMGIAIRSNHTLNLDFPSWVWKPMVEQSLDQSDLSAIDTPCSKYLDLIRNEGQSAISEDEYSVLHCPHLSVLSVCLSSCLYHRHRLIRTSQLHSVMVKWWS